MLSLVTVGAIPEHRCYIPDVDSDEIAAPWNFTGILSAIPTDENGGLSSCLMYSGNSTITCDKYVYDKTFYQSTRATEWNFVCDKRWMIAIAQVKSLIDIRISCIVYLLTNNRMDDNYFFYVKFVTGYLELGV